MSWLNKPIYSTQLELAKSTNFLKSDFANVPHGNTLA